MKILVTGAAGFIGYHLTKALLVKGYEIVGLDCLNNYYDVNLKLTRLARCGITLDEIQYNRVVRSKALFNYKFIKLNIEDAGAISRLFAQENFDIVCNLAAQAGVRYSIENPYAYLTSNLEGFLTILETCRHYPVKHLFYASSSSVYGLNQKVPYAVEDKTDNPVSLYAATKKSNELMAHVYTHLYKIPTTGLRFFTVYGPWGRPDMAPMLFAKAIQQGKPIKVFNEGNLKRDFTYIDDIIEGVMRIIELAMVQCADCENKMGGQTSDEASYKIYNIGNAHPVELMYFIELLEKALGKVAQKIYLPMQKGDVYETYADVSGLERDVHYSPKTSIEEGVARFVDWYRSYYM